MTKFWKVKPDLFKKNIIDLYTQEPTSLTRILAFVHELKASRKYNVSNGIYGIDLFLSL